MKREFILTIVGVSVGLLSFIGAPAYARGGSHGAGGGFSGGRHAGFSAAGHTSFGAGCHASGVSHGYSGAGISHGAGGCARASMHLESRADATAATAATGKAITHREP